MISRFDPVIRHPDDALDWRDLPDPENLLASKGEIYFAGFYQRIAALYEQSGMEGNQALVLKRCIPQQVRDLERACSCWLTEAEACLPDWMGSL